MSGIKKIARERNMTATEAAKRFGRSPRTIRRLVALDREDYLKRAAERRQKIYDMRSVGFTFKEISETIGMTYNSVRSTYYQYVKQLREKQAKKEEKLDNFSLF
jgi:DNA-directed RNA polymerase specialized sigma24 family protein